MSDRCKVIIIKIFTFFIVIKKIRKTCRRILMEIFVYKNYTISSFLKYKLNNKGLNLSNYSEWQYKVRYDKSNFVDILDDDYKRKNNDVKIFAYYLPQFHSIKENDDAHGKGFTEWTNVSQTAPQFVGHIQPQIPYDVGFYNLENIDVMKRQAELARKYGVYGFCFYYYWFSGKKVLEKPLLNFLNSDIDLKFHLCWANENWSKLWNGGNKEIILKQELLDGDAEKFFNDILPFIKDKRYEKIENKPILMIYRPTLFSKENMKKYCDKLNYMAKENGFDGFYFISANVELPLPLEDYGIDAITEFPPHGVFNKAMSVHKHFLNSKCNLNVCDIQCYIDNEKYISKNDYQVFKCCFPAWDNSSRKMYSGGWVFLTNVKLFKKWLQGIIEWTKNNNTSDKQIVYINAWNEWAEGAHLEPDVFYGYANLNVVRECMEESK